MFDYTLLVDETGFDGASKRIMYVGCLFENNELDGVKDTILDFNKRCLDDPLYSGKKGLVNSVNEPRHFVDDTMSLKVRFRDEVLRKIPYRVYAVFDIPKATVKESKVELFKAFINYVKQVREIKSLNVIIESSGTDDKYLEECGAKFLTKEYLPLCIADYYGGVLHRFHELRLKYLETGIKINSSERTQVELDQYYALVDRISFERDLSTKETSSRRNGRYFLEQIQGIVSND